MAVSSAGWACQVIHTAHLDKSCEATTNPVAGEGACIFDAMDEPDGWDTASFDALEWLQADVFTAREVGPKDGYDDINWDPKAELIWGPDLEQSNTVLCRITVN